MKKMTALVLSLLLLFALCACGEKESISIAGTWQLSDQNDDETLAAFGSSLHAYGAEMTLSEDGTFSFYIGLTGGEGTYTAEDEDSYNVTYKDYNEGQEFTAELELEDDGATLSLELGDEDVLWTKAE